MVPEKWLQSKALGRNGEKDEKKVREEKKGMKQEEKEGR